MILNFTSLIRCNAVGDINNNCQSTVSRGGGVDVKFSALPSLGMLESLFKPIVR